MQPTQRPTLSTLSALTRAATASASGRAAEIEKETGAVSRVIRLDQIRVKPQVRHDFTDIDDFAERLQMVGHVHTPILVREINGDEQFELIAGERRVRASKVNRWQEIPAKIFPAATSDLKIRMYQVSENIDRRDLSLKETAVGLAADVDQYGREEAARIWAGKNGKHRGGPWISKHLRFQKYGPITRALFDENHFDDVEAANKLADIEAINADVAAEFATEMREGRKVGRLALEAKLATLRSDEKPQDESHAPVDPGAVTTSTPDLAPASRLGGNTGGPIAPEVRDQAPSGQQSAESQHTASPTAVNARIAENGQTDSAPARAKQQSANAADPATSMIWRIEEIYQTATGSIGRIKGLLNDLSTAGVGARDTDWHLYVAFVNIAASALVGVGPETAGRIMNMFNADLNSRGPLELLNRLHPTTRAGVLPDDFGYDTEREIHPLAPGDWEL